MFDGVLLIAGLAAHACAAHAAPLLKYASFSVRTPLKITCQTRDSLPLDALTEFQTDIKKRSSRDVKFIIASFDRHGFSFPFYVWKNGANNFIIDGHGRLTALRWLRNVRAKSRRRCQSCISPRRTKRRRRRNCSNATRATGCLSRAR